MRYSRPFVLLLFMLTIVLSTCSNASTKTTTTTLTTAITETPSTTANVCDTQSANTTVTNGLGLQALTVYIIDVGQGDAILLDQGDTELLIDGGDRSPGVIDFLNQYVDGSLETIVATHPHADHIGGLIAVLDTFQVEDVWVNGETSTSKTYADFVAAVDAESATLHTARVHDIVTAGELLLLVHHPANIDNTTNNNSIVLSLRYGDTDFMFMGDAEVEAEGEMMMLSSIQLPDVDILKVGHHGSRTASSPDFLSIIRPEIAIYMAKTGNSYGHPHEETIAALNAIGAQIYGTDVNGTVVVTTDGVAYSVTTTK